MSISYKYVMVPGFPYLGYGAKLHSCGEIGKKMGISKGSFQPKENLAVSEVGVQAGMMRYGSRQVMSTQGIITNTQNRCQLCPSLPLPHMNSGAQRILKRCHSTLSNGLSRLPTVHPILHLPVTAEKTEVATSQGHLRLAPMPRQKSPWSLCLCLLHSPFGAMKAFQMGGLNLGGTWKVAGPKAIASACWRQTGQTRAMCQ